MNTEVLRTSFIHVIMSHWYCTFSIYTQQFIEKKIPHLLHIHLMENILVLSPKYKVSPKQ